MRLIPSFLIESLLFALRYILAAKIVPEELIFSFSLISLSESVSPPDVTINNQKLHFFSPTKIT